MKEVNDVKENIMNLFSKDYKQRKVAGTFDDNYVKYSSEGNDGQLSIEQ